MSLHRARIKSFEDLLGEDVINLSKLQQLSFHGVPEEKGLRAFVWKVLLNYMPLERNAQVAEMANKRKLYESFIKEIVVLHERPPSDHPLNVKADSSWNIYFNDNEFLLQIDKDVRRLCPDINFFQTATDFPCADIVNSNGLKRLHTRIAQPTLAHSTVQQEGLGIFKLMNIKRHSGNDPKDYCPLQEGSEAHWEVVERILFLYAKLNPGQSYVQGMNEIIGPIYHTFACDPVLEFRKNAEADTFFCFTNLMSEIRDFYIRSLDGAESGIQCMMKKVDARLKQVDLVVWKRLHKQELLPEYYTFRWLTLLFSQTFTLPDVQRLWDSLFSDPERFDMLINTCCAMVMLIRKYILTGDFSANMKVLQTYPLTDISRIMQKSLDVQDALTED